MDRDDRFDLIWGRITRVLSFFGGLGIMIFETVFDKGHEKLYLYSAAIGMMTLSVASRLEKLIDRLKKLRLSIRVVEDQEPQEEDPEETQSNGDKGS